MFATSATLALFVAMSTAHAGGAESDAPNGTPWNPAHSDQWVATDDLGRPLPTVNEAGETRPDKYIACFYFLWLGRHGDAGPYNISQILEEHPEARDDPDSPYWGKLGVPHHWGESIFGYYVGEDESVLRKHAQMLGDAGVDVICFDVTNQLTYPESYRPLFKVFSEMQKEGNKVPKVAFLCPFWAPNKVVRELWREVYSQNFYPDVWFNWKGKPLILADPAMLESSVNLNSSGAVPVEIADAGVLAQTFSIDKSFIHISLTSPTWNGNGCAINFVLRDEAGNAVFTREAVDIQDNMVYSFVFDEPLPAGVYTAELSKARGERVGWWSRAVAEDDYSSGAAKVCPTPNVVWIKASANGKSLSSVYLMNVDIYDEERENILNFFTFRPSQPDYFAGPTKPNQWSWLEAYPQHEYYNDKGELEEMGVGVAQNAVEGKLGVLSNPEAYGRSFHAGAEPKPENCDYTGKNFQEQWERALQVDPEIIFVTGWNEWIAGRFDINAPFHGATPVSFVDQFNEEFSRDCEPMKGGHGDDYYYQMISNIRRFKGVSRPTPAVTGTIVIDGVFDDWKSVEPRYFDTVVDPVHRDSRGWGKDQRYVNHTGRNDFVESRVSYDKDNVYFYVKTRDQIQGDPSSANWITLLLDTDENTKTGANGNDYIVISSKDGKGLELIATKVVGGVGQRDQDFKAVPIEYRLSGAEIELKIPRDALRLTGNKPVFRFKWTDGIDVFGDWSGFTTDGDAAPNDRYYYRYEAP